MCVSWAHELPSWLSFGGVDGIRGILCSSDCLAAGRAHLANNSSAQAILSMPQTAKHFEVRSLLSLLATVTEQRPFSRITRGGIERLSHHVVLPHSDGARMPSRSMSWELPMDLLFPEQKINLEK